MSRRAAVAGRRNETKTKSHASRVSTSSGEGPRAAALMHSGRFAMGPAVTSSAAREARGGSARRQRRTTLTRCVGRAAGALSRQSALVLRSLPTNGTRSLSHLAERRRRCRDPFRARALHQHHIKLMQCKLPARQLKPSWLAGVVCLLWWWDSTSCVSGRRDFSVWYRGCAPRWCADALWLVAGVRNGRFIAASRPFLREWIASVAHSLSSARVGVRNLFFSAATGMNLPRVKVGRVCFIAVDEVPSLILLSLPGYPVELRWNCFLLGFYTVFYSWKIKCS